MSSEEARRVDRESIVLTGTKREERLVSCFRECVCVSDLLFRRHTIHLASELPIMCSIVLHLASEPQRLFSQLCFGEFLFV